MRFKVIAVSSTTNSFGLRGMVLVARDGTAYQVGANSLNVLPRGAEVDLGDPLNFARHGFEIPEQLPTAPEAVLSEVWAA